MAHRRIQPAQRWHRGRMTGEELGVEKQEVESLSSQGSTVSDYCSISHVGQDRKPTEDLEISGELLGNQLLMAVRL